jgi:hypothetical protein
MSKIILDLINNYEQTPYFEENQINELNEIKKSNIELIENNIEILKQLNSNFTADYIRKTNIDEIYIDIIISLIDSLILIRRKDTK